MWVLCDFEGWGVREDYGCFGDVECVVYCFGWDVREVDEYVELVYFMDDFFVEFGEFVEFGIVGWWVGLIGVVWVG